MTMQRIEPGPFIVPMPIVLVGADVGGKPNWSKISPLLFTFPDPSYWKLGDYVAKAWHVGKNYEPRL